MSVLNLLAIDWAGDSTGKRRPEVRGFKLPFFENNVWFGNIRLLAFSSAIAPSILLMRFNPLILFLTTLSSGFIAKAAIASQEKSTIQIFRLDRLFPGSENCLIVPNDWQNPNFNANLVIEDETTWRARISLNPSKFCMGQGYPAIDWNRYTLIFARYRLPGGCSNRATGFALRLTRDDSHRLYHHTAIINPGPCAGDSHAETWLLVPKLPPGYRVEFQQTQDPSLVIYSDDFLQY